MPHPPVLGVQYPGVWFVIEAKAKELASMKDDVKRQSSFDARKVDSSALLSLTFSKCLRGQLVMEEFPIMARE